MKHKSAIAITIFFLSVLFLTPLLLFLSGDKEFSENENRYLEQKPELTLDRILSCQFMKQMETYVNDQFPFRDTWTAAKSDLLQLTGNREINGVYLGKDGYLLEKWLPGEFNEAQLEENIRAVNSFAKRHPDQKTTVMIVPTAGQILKEKLPKHAPMFDQTAAFRLIAGELDDADFLDASETLFAHADEEIYYRTDHHWTSRGAFYGYSQWCRQNDLPVSIDDFHVETVSDTFQGSLYSKVLGSGCASDQIQIYRRKEEPEYTVSYRFGESESSSVYAMEHLTQKDQYQIFLDGNHPEISIQTARSNGRHLLLIKDSFANAMIPFLLHDYESIHIIDLRYFRSDLEDYISEKQITEFLFLYNIKNFCEDSNLEPGLQ